MVLKIINNFVYGNENMKTILQIATEIGVTKQAIFYRIKRPPLSNALQSLTTKENGILMVSFDGETLIKSAFHVETVKSFVAKEPSKENTFFDGEIIKLLQDNILILQEQLKIKDKQIEELTATVRIQAESINAAHHNELAETIIDGKSNVALLENNTKKKRRPVWQFWKK
jgi:hypothetical protein